MAEPPRSLPVWTPGEPFPPYPPAAIQHAEWQWVRPLAAILSFGGWTIHDVVSSRRVAAQVRALWRVLALSRRLEAEREAEEALQTQLWWRAMDLPVPCPACGLGPEDACSCPSRLLRDETRPGWQPSGTAF